MSELHLDTHVIVWLAGEQHHRLPAGVRAALNAHPLRYSPIVRLELAYLHEIGRISEGGERVLDGLAETVGLRESDATFGLVAHVAAGQSFARDPFDRIITAQALVAKARLVTKDRLIQDTHPELTLWE